MSYVARGSGNLSKVTKESLMQSKGALLSESCRLQTMKAAGFDTSFPKTNSQRQRICVPLEEPGAQTKKRGFADMQSMGKGQVFESKETDLGT